jgi:hypothetical protein
MTWGQQLYFPLKEVMLRILIALKNPLLSTRFEPTNPGSSGEHDDTTESDKCKIYF